MPIRCCCKARAFCMRSRGKPLTLGGGLLAFWRLPETLELGLMKLVFWGSETVRSDGTRRGKSTAPAGLGMTSESELGGSKGVLASEDSSTDPGEAGLLSSVSSKASGEELAWRSAMAVVLFGDPSLGCVTCAVGEANGICVRPVAAGRQDEISRNKRMAAVGVMVE